MSQRELPNKPILIPSSAKKVFDGQLFEVFQWQQEMFDGSYEIFEMLKRPDTVIVCGIDEGQVVVCDERQPGGVFRENHLPAGRIDSTDKTTLSAAQREMKEETGLEFRRWALVEVFQPESKIEWFVYLYLAMDVTTRGTPKLDPGEKIDVKQVSYETAYQFNTKQSKFSVLGKYPTLETLCQKVGWDV